MIASVGSLEIITEHLVSSMEFDQYSTHILLAPPPKKIKLDWEETGLLEMKLTPTKILLNYIPLL